MIFDARIMARALGGDVVGTNAVLVPGPGHSTRDRSLSIRIDPRAPAGFIVYSHSPANDPIECRDFVRQKLGIAPWAPGQRETSRPIPMTVVDNDDDAEQRRNWALQLWRDARNPRGTAVERYLGSRGLDLADDVAGEVIRFHPKLKYQNDTVHGMISLLRDIHTDEPCGIHRTFFDANAHKIDRKMLGRAKGAAIKLDADDTVTLGLCIGEGVETCIAGRLAGLRPVWALGSAGAIAAFPVLSGIDALTIFAETDDANASAVKMCARRWLLDGREVSAAEPNVGGDLNDAVLRKACS
jgi:hypothetical protein